MIEIKALSCGYGKQDVLKEIDLNLNDGELAGILGPNGSGKSTLILSLSGVLSYRSGSIKVDGEEIARTPARLRARKMASVPQKSELTFPFKCLSIVLMGRYPYLPRWGGYSKEDIDKALDAMEQTETIQFAQRMITEVSGGEAQRVIIARALAQETGILLLDEATSSLDVAKKIQIFDLLKKKNTRGMTLLCAMHDLNPAALYCERLIFLKEGRIVLDGSTQETFTDKNLSEIYETDVRISRHPVTGSPQAHFVPGLEGRPDHADPQSHGSVESSRLGDTDY